MPSHHLVAVVAGLVMRQTLQEQMEAQVAEVDITIVLAALEIRHLQALRKEAMEVLAQLCLILTPVAAVVVLLVLEPQVIRALVEAMVEQVHKGHLTLRLLVVLGLGVHHQQDILQVAVVVVLEENLLGQAFQQARVALAAAVVGRQGLRLQRLVVLILVAGAVETDMWLRIAATARQAAPVSSSSRSINKRSHER